jgi:hypothetical protein
MYNNAVKAMQKHMVKKGPADSSEFHGLPESSFMEKSH